MLEINLQCQFNDFYLDIKEQLPSDKIIGLFGQSGSGKSKFIRQLLGFDVQYQRKVSVKFKSSTWQKKSERRFELTENRGIGYLPQTIDLFPHLNIRKNVLFGLKTESDDIQSEIHENIFYSLNIENLLNKYPSQLSGGQQQRVGLARAILAAKNLLILDEPFSAIGEDHKPKIMQVLKNIHVANKLPIIFSSHNRYEHAYLTEHLLTFRNGKVIQSGNYHNIATDINKNFAQVPDAINHLKATVINFDQTFSVNHLKAGNYDLWAGELEIKKNQSVTLEIRARDISISIHKINNISILNSLKVKIVDSKEIYGHQYLLKLSFENSFLIAFITKKSFIDLNLKIGMDVYAMFKAVSILPISVCR